MTRPKQKRIVIDEGTVKRVKKAGYRQETGRGSVCLICRGPFMSCPHSYKLVDDMIAVVRQHSQFEIRI